MHKLVLSLGLLFLLLGTGLIAQEDVSHSKRQSIADTGVRRMAWREDLTIQVRVPVAGRAKVGMTTIQLPEKEIQNAVSGFTSRDLSIQVTQGYVSLRLLRKVEGEMTLWGGSGRLYLLSIRPSKEDGYDRFLRIEVTDKGSPLTKKTRRGKPVGSLTLMRAMRVGARPEGVRIRGAERELMLRTERLEIRLLYVYERPPYVGRVYEITNRLNKPLSLDASRLRPKTSIRERLVASGLRENLLSPDKSTYLYMIFWSQP